MTERVLRSSKKKSDMKASDHLKTPDKDNSEKIAYSETPVSTESRRRSLVVLSENHQESPTFDPNLSSESVEANVRIEQRNSLDKVRMSLFHGKERKTGTKGNIFSVNAKSFYGTTTERAIPLAPESTMSPKLVKNKKSPLHYDFPDKKVARKRKRGEINSGVGHGIKKSKQKGDSIKKEPVDADQHIVIENQCENSQKENFEEAESSQNSIEDYNPNKKFFKYKRPAKLKISVGSKPKQKKDKKQKDSTVSYSNIFGSSKSKKQFYEKLNAGHAVNSNLKAQSTVQYNPEIVKKESFDHDSQHQEDDQQKTHESTDVIADSLINSEECSNLESDIENAVDADNNNEQSDTNFAMDIENNNFSNDEMMTDMAIYDDEELDSQLTGTTLYFMESLVPDVGSQQNSLEENLTDNGNQQYCSVTNEYINDSGQSDVSNVQCQECHFVYKLGDQNEEAAHSDYHSDFCNLQFKGWKRIHEIVTGNESKIVIVKPFDPESHKKKAYDVLKVINKELSLSDEDLVENYKKYFFIYVKQDSIIGVVVAENLDFAFLLESNPSVPSRLFSEPVPVKCGVTLIWVSSNHRRQRIATTLLDSVRKYFLDNCEMKLDDIAFSIPPSTGKLFAQKYSGTNDIKVF